MGTAKKFYTSIASLSHTNKVTGHETAYGWFGIDSAGHRHDSGSGRHDEHYHRLILL